MAGRKSARRMSKCIVGICVVLQFAFVIQYGPSLFQNSFHWRSLRLGGGRVDGDDNATTVATKAAAEAVTRTAMTPTTPPTTTTTESTAAASSTVVDDNENVRMPHPNVKLEWEAKEFMRMFGLACKSSKKPVDPNACPCTPPRLVGRLPLKLVPTPLKRIRAANPAVMAGGAWRPTDCVARQKVAIIIPYKDRRDHLAIFLHHMHPVLQRQQLDYRIFVVEQAFPDIFNKGSLMNIGYLKASEFIDFDCIIFHDVDMLLEDDRHIYSCSEGVRHMGANVNKFQYKIGYNGIFGGATAFNKAQFQTVNGFGNKFFGWGGEDDDMNNRVKARRLRIIRYPQSVSRYTMIAHGRDTGNPLNPNRNTAWSFRPGAYVNDGLNSIKYKVHNVSALPLYTWLYVEPITVLSQYSIHFGSCPSNMFGTNRKLAILDCARACADIVSCQAFSHIDHRCLLMEQPCRPAELLSCKQQYCTRTYYKKNFKGIIATELQDNFVMEAGDCLENDLTNDLTNESANVTQCARLCIADAKCRGFVFEVVSQECMLKSRVCLEPIPEDNTFVFYRLEGKPLDAYTSRVGDCRGGDLSDHELSRKTCAFKCALLPKCVAFTYVSGQTTACWLKKTTCRTTNSARDAVTYDKRPLTDVT